MSTIGTSGSISIGNSGSSANHINSTAFGRSGNTANSSLKELSDGTVGTINVTNLNANKPDTSAPHAMSEFYSYDHDAAASAGTSLVMSNQAESRGSYSYSTISNGTTVQTTATGGSKVSGEIIVRIVISNASGNSAVSTNVSGAGTGIEHAWSSNENMSSPSTYSDALSSLLNITGTTFYYHQRVVNSSSNVFNDLTTTFTNNSVSTNFVHDWNLAITSDRRLKTDIKRIRTSPSGIPVYEFRFKEDLEKKWEGVMAQDLLEMGIEDVVNVGKDGYYSVDYDKIDVNMIQVVEI